MSEARKMILNMLAEGKITVEESEKLLAALGGESKPTREQEQKARIREREREADAEADADEKAQRRRDNDESFNPFGGAGKFGFDLRNLAQTIQHTVQQAVKQLSRVIANLRIK